MQFIGQNISPFSRHNIIFYKKNFDRILRTEDGTVFTIHRVILTQYEYFRALFNFEGNDNTTDILMKNIGSHTLRQILQYIYKETLQLDEENVLDLMVAADYLLLDDLTEPCRDYAIQHITPSNCLSLLTTASRYEHLNIFPECLRYVKVHFELIVKNFPDKIADLPIDILMKLLKDNSLNVTSEETVWTAIVIWVNADFFKRNQHVPDLLNCIRFEEEKSSVLNVVHNVIGIFDQFCIESNSYPYSPSKSSFLQRILYRETASRLPKYLHLIISCRMSQSGIYLTCDEELDFCRKVGAAPLIPHTIVPIGKYVYFFLTYGSVFLRYGLLDDSMVPLKGIMNGINYCIVVLDKKIYILGGRTESFEDIDTVEYYDPDSEKWNRVRSVGRTIIMAAAPLCGKLYAIGYTCNGFQSVVWMSVYDPITDTWNTTEFPRWFDPTFSVVAFENHLYLVGEGNTHGGSTYVGEYDPVLDAWTRLPDLPLNYLKPKPLVLAGKFLLFDNFNDRIYDKDMRPVSPAVCWDGVTRTWKITDKSFAFHKNLERYRFGILDDPAVVREVVNRSRLSTVQWDRIFSSE